MMLVAKGNAGMRIIWIVLILFGVFMLCIVGAGVVAMLTSK